MPSSLSPALALVSTTPASLLGSIQPVLVHTTGAKNYTREGILVRDKMKIMKSLYLVRPGEAEIYTPADKQKVDYSKLQWKPVTLASKQ